MFMEIFVGKGGNIGGVGSNLMVMMGTEIRSDLCVHRHM